MEFKVVFQRLQDSFLNHDIIFVTRIFQLASVSLQVGGLEIQPV